MSSKQALAGFNTYKTLTTRTGSLTSALGAVLNKHKITTQAYHSRSFVGNHATNTSNQTFNQILQKQSSNKPFLIDESHAIQITFNNLNSTFMTQFTSLYPSQHL